MKFALIDGDRREPQPGLSGQCPGCHAPVIARCGEIKVWHWAHKGKKPCDPWWESETEWHRSWKGLFPVEWQEVPLRAESGELHIADVRTPTGLVLEFQHSAIKPDERRSRESFYGNMLWIVDGSRLLRDRPRVDAEVWGWRRSAEGNITQLSFPEWALPKAWVECDVPVLFDFDGLTRQEDFREEREPPSVMRPAEWWNSRRATPDPLFCLLPKRFRGNAVWFTIRRETLPKIATGENKLLDWQEAHRQLEARHPIKPEPRRRNRHWLRSGDWRF